MSKRNLLAASIARSWPMAACGATLLAMSSPTFAATTRAVTNCNQDNSAGSLRSTIGLSASGDTVDMSGLTPNSPGCGGGTTSVITLSTGDIRIFQTALNIKGPGSDKLTITGKYGFLTWQPYRVMTHYGTGTLALAGMTLAQGRLTNATNVARGGCIYSSGNVILQSDVTATGCVASTTSGLAKGGGIYAKGGFIMIRSSVTSNMANGGTSGNPTGGGIYARGVFGASYSSISNNYADGGSGNLNGKDGAITALGSSVYILASTIANNTAGKNIGGIEINNAAGTAKITNSTISGNVAKTGGIGGLYVQAAATYILNSTIAHNTAATSVPYSQGAGVALYGGGATPVAVLKSTLISSNAFGTTPTNQDITTFGVTISGSENLIRVPNAAVPAGTIVGQCPFLAPLRNNGGVTLTHALRGHSPAIDAGDNDVNKQFDQRGTPYARALGPPGVVLPVPDIGAYEVDRRDEIFDADFEDCG